MSVEVSKVPFVATLSGALLQVRQAGNNAIGSVRTKLICSAEPLEGLFWEYVRSVLYGFYDYYYLLRFIVCKDDACQRSDRRRQRAGAQSGNWYTDLQQKAQQRSVCTSS